MLIVFSNSIIFAKVPFGFPQAKSQPEPPYTIDEETQPILALGSISQLL